MRIVYPTITSMGLGNNLITLAKAHLIAESCNMTYQRPEWPSNIHVWPPTKSGYGYYFPTTVADKVRLSLFSYQLRIQRKLSNRLWPPAMLFRREDYWRTGILDMGEACLAHMKTLGLDDPSRSAVVTTSGMWGGYSSIRRAQRWLYDLLMSHSETRRRYEEIEAQAAGRFKIAVNIKLGSYSPHRGRFEEGERNFRIPLDWYIRVCKQIREVSDCAFILVTDGTEEELSEFVNEIQPIHYLGQSYTDLLGLQLLMHSDMVVCSNSTYSRLGCFLNDKPYIWIGDTLVKDASGRYGYIWVDTGAPMPRRVEPNTSSLNKSHDATRRCYALNYGFSSLPEGLNRYLKSGGKLEIEVPDDLLYFEAAYLL